MPSTRRRFLALGGSLVAAVAGCVSEAPGRTESTPDETEPATTGPPDETKPAPSPTPTEPPDDRRRRVGGRAVALTDVVVRKAVTYEAMMGSGGVAAPEDAQFVVAGVHADAGLEADAFALRAGGESWSPSIPGERGGGTFSVAGHEGAPVGESAGDDGPRFVAFRVPSPLDVDDAAITFSNAGETATWSLDDAAVDALGAPGPTFALDSLDVPDAVSQGEQLPVSLTVTNTSHVDGRFLAAVYWPTKLIADDDESRLVEARVGAGETVTRELRIDTEYTTNEDGPVTLSVDGHVSASTEVEVRNAGTPS